jgi:hypothetical protein
MGGRAVENCIGTIIEGSERWMMTITANKYLRSCE